MIGVGVAGARSIVTRVVRIALLKSEDEERVLECKHTCELVPLEVTV